jgi:hypothetical protein
MCTQITTLAESNDFRHILKCEHGTVHLSWDLATLYFNLSEFEQIGCLLEQGLRLVEPAKLVESPWMLVYKKEGYYQLWLRNVAINLTPVDFLILVDMVRVALGAVGLAKGSKEAGEWPQGLQATVQASARMSFSIN